MPLQYEKYEKCFLSEINLLDSRVESRSDGDVGSICNGKRQLRFGDHLVRLLLRKQRGRSGSFSYSIGSVRHNTTECRRVDSGAITVRVWNSSDWIRELLNGFESKD